MSITTVPLFLGIVVFLLLILLIAFVVVSVVCGLVMAILLFPIASHTKYKLVPSRATSNGTTVPLAAHFGMSVMLAVLLVFPYLLIDLFDGFFDFSFVFRGGGTIVVIGMAGTVYWFSWKSLYRDGKISSKRRNRVLLTFVLYCVVLYCAVVFLAVGIQ